MKWLIHVTGPARNTTHVMRAGRSAEASTGKGVPSAAVQPPASDEPAPFRVPGRFM